VRTRWVQSTIFRRILFAIFAVSLIPLVIFGLLAWRSGSAAGTASVISGREVLFTQAADSLELRASETASALARFLQERENDLRTLALLPTSDEVYLDFYNEHAGVIWTTVDGEETRLTLPLYREIAYIHMTGQETIKITDGRVAGSGDLRDVSNDANTTYLSEIYFSQARWLEPGDIYVGHVAGFYVDQEAATRGEEFTGVVRFAMPLHDERGRFQGMIVTALDSRHLAEFTAHIVPTEERYALRPDAATSNFAFIVDDQAYFIAHPEQTWLRGLDPEGAILPVALSNEDIGTYPIRIDLLGFIDEDLASIYYRTREGESGSLQYDWNGITKFVAYAPIAYYGGEYEEPAGFGWVGISADLGIFQESASLVGAIIREKVDEVSRMALILGAATLVGVLTVAALLARNISDPVERIAAASQSIESGEYKLDMLRPLLRRGSNEDFARLARVFRQMADEVQKREQYYKLLDAVVSIGVALPQEKDFDRLLEKVVVAAQELTHADGGSLYFREDNHLRFVILRNDSLGITQGGTSGNPIDLPRIGLYDEDGQENHQHIASHTVHARAIVNIADAYESKDFNFSGTRAFDTANNYRSKSFLCVPLMDNEGEILGVLQLINAREPESGKVVTFDPGLNTVMESLAALGTVTMQFYIREAQLRERIAQLQIHIDETRKKEEVAQITESEYFQQLQVRARQIRTRKQRREKKDQGS
jgi:HAMP domain-containing protein